MLFKLSLRNIRRSIKNYAIYFFTLVLGVSIFYIFNSLESQTVMMNISANLHEIVELTSGIMPVLGVFVAVVLGFLIIYASRFLMKRRKKEFGIYMTLGMGKGQISRILLLETLAIGVISLVIGLIVGILFSQLMSVFIANMFEADMSKYQFVFSLRAMLMTVLLFGVIYLVVCIFNSISIGRQKIINLIHSDKMGEKIKIRNLAVCIIAFLLAVALLVFAYTGVTGNLTDLDSQKMVVCIVAGIVGTFLLFFSWSGLALRILKRIKRLYFKNLNMFISREIDSKINTTVISMSVVCLLLFMVIGGFSTAMSIRNSMTKNLQELSPADFQAKKIVVGNWHDNDDVEQARRYSLSAADSMAEIGVDTNEIFKEFAEIYTYQTEEIDFNKTFGVAISSSQLDINEVQSEFLSNQIETLVKVGDYNKFAKLFHLEEIDLNNNEYAVVANYSKVVELRNKAMKNNKVDLQIDDRILSPKFDKVMDGFLTMSANRSNVGIIVIPDNINLAGHEISSILVGNYEAENKDDRARIEALISDKLVKSGTYFEYRLNVDTKTLIYENSIGIKAMMTFVGLYLGSVFLIVSAALLALKEVSDSSDNKEKYLTMRELGVDQKVLNRTLLIQIGIFFGLPLLVAVIHSIFGIAFANNVILTFTEVDLLSSIIITALFMVIIYGGYFLITYFTSKRIIMDRD